MFPRNVPNGAGRNGVPERSERRSPGNRPASRATEIEVAGTPQKDTLPEKIEKPPVAALHRTSPTPPPSSTSSPSPPSRARSSTRRSAAHRLPLRLRHRRLRPRPPPTCRPPQPPDLPQTLISLISRSGAPLHQTTTDAALDQASALSTSACAPTAALTRSSASTPLPRPRRLLHHLLHPSPRLGIPPARPPAPTSPPLPPFMPATPQPKTVVLLLPYPPPPHQTLPASTHPFA